jgi:hypothetical protein
VVETVVPSFGPGSGADVIATDDMCLTCFGSHHGGDKIHEIAFVTSPRIRVACWPLGGSASLMWDLSKGGESVLTRHFVHVCISG